jgi:carbon-monoxide dehydrogenase small subunit
MSNKTYVKAVVNNEPVEFLCEPRQSLLEVLRDVLYLTGTKEGCNDGNCGACCIISDGVLVNACCMLGVESEGSHIETIEGMAGDDALHPLQVAFIEHSALQCGFCTPGILMSSKALLDHNKEPSEDEIRYWLAGNLCRCTGYDRIVRAVMSVRDQEAHSNDS